MEPPSQRYRKVSSRFRELARSEDCEANPEPATAEEVSAAERALGCRFPDSYRWFQLELGDFAHGPLDIYSVRGAGPPIVNINLDARRAGYPRLPPHLIAFSDSGGGDFYCFDASDDAGDEGGISDWVSLNEQVTDTKSHTLVSNFCTRISPVPLPAIPMVDP